MDKGFVTTREDVESNPIVRRRRLRRKKIEQLGDSAQNNGPAAEDNANAETSVLWDLAKRLSSADTGAGSVRIIAVEVNGTLIKMGPEAYEIFKKQRQELRALRSRSKDLPQQAPDVELPPSKANPADAGV